VNLLVFSVAFVTEESSATFTAREKGTEKKNRRNTEK